MPTFEAQICKSNDPWTTIHVQSNSRPDITYEVIVPYNGAPPSEYICNCEGFLFRGQCSHQTTAYDTMCGWAEFLGPEKQTEKEKENYICPRCKGQTRIGRFDGSSYCNQQEAWGRV